VGAPGGEKARGGRVEHELEHLPSLALHLEAPAMLVNGDHRGGFETTAEMGDPRASAGAGNGSGGAEHRPMLRGAPIPEGNRARPPRAIP
jgi:hypothetical protein